MGIVNYDGLGTLPWKQGPSWRAQNYDALGIHALNHCQMPDFQLRIITEFDVLPRRDAHRPTRLVELYPTVPWPPHRGPVTPLTLSRRCGGERERKRRLVNSRGNL